MDGGVITSISESDSIMWGRKAEGSRRSILLTLVGVPCLEICDWSSSEMYVSSYTANGNREQGQTSREAWPSVTVWIF